MNTEEAFELGPMGYSEFLRPLANALFKPATHPSVEDESGSHGTKADDHHKHAHEEECELLGCFNADEECLF